MRDKLKPPNHSASPRARAFDRIGHLDLEGISRVVAGGESGPRHRPINPDWVREVRDQCHASGTAKKVK